MVSFIRKSFFEKKGVIVGVVETKNNKGQRILFLAIALSSCNDTIFFRIPRNRILRAIELVSILKDKEHNIESIEKLWKDMDSDPLDCEVYRENQEQIIQIFESLIKNEINPPIDELREVAYSLNSEIIERYLEALLREGIGARMTRLADEPTAKTNKKDFFRKLLPPRRM